MLTFITKWGWTTIQRQYFSLFIRSIFLHFNNLPSFFIQYSNRILSFGFLFVLTVVLLFVERIFVVFFVFLVFQSPSLFLSSFLPPPLYLSSSRFLSLSLSRPTLCLALLHFLYRSLLLLPNILTHWPCSLTTSLSVGKLSKIMWISLCLFIPLKIALLL